MKSILFAALMTVSTVAIAEDYDPAQDPNLQQRIEDATREMREGWNRPYLPDPGLRECRATDADGWIYRGFSVRARAACKEALKECRRRSWRPATCRL